MTDKYADLVRELQAKIAIGCQDMEPGEWYVEISSVERDKLCAAITELQARVRDGDEIRKWIDGLTDEQLDKCEDKAIEAGNAAVNHMGFDLDAYYNAFRQIEIRFTTVHGWSCP